MKPEEIYKKIDKIDRELLVLLQERMGYVLRSNKFEQSAPQPLAAEDMLTRFEQLNLDLRLGCKPDVAALPNQRNQLAITLAKTASSEAGPGPDDRHVERLFR